MKFTFLLWLVSGLVLLPLVSASADETVDWFELRSNRAFSLEPLGENACQVESEVLGRCGAVYLELHSVDGVLKRAILNSDRDPFLTPKKLEFVPAEMAGLEIYRDVFKRAWVKRLALSQRLAGFLLQQAKGLYCNGSPEVTDPLGTPWEFRFPTEKLGEEVVVVHSNCVRFTATDADGKTLQVASKFIQTRYKPIEPVDEN